MTEGLSVTLGRSRGALNRTRPASSRRPARAIAQMILRIIARSWHLAAGTGRFRAGWLLGCLALGSGLSQAAPIAAAIAAAPALDDALVGACRGCHSFGSGSAAPSAAGESSAFVRLDQYSAATLEQKLLAYRLGETDATLMSRIARGYSEQQLARIAAAIAASKR